MTPPSPVRPVAPPTGGEPLSAFAAAIAEAEADRPVEAFDVAGFFGLGDRPIPHIGIRKPTQTEQDRALVQAHKYVEALTTGAPSAAQDEDILRNAKMAAIAAEFCRAVEPVPGKPGEWRPTGYPAFPSAKWMMSTLDPERISVLLNLANEYRARTAPSPAEIDDVTVEAYLSVCVTAAEPEYSLVGLSREYVVQLAIIAATKLAAARAQIERMAERIAELEAGSAPADAAAEPEPA